MSTKFSKFPKFWDNSVQLTGPNQIRFKSTFFWSHISVSVFSSLNSNFTRSVRIQQDTQKKRHNTSDPRSITVFLTYPLESQKVSQCLIYRVTLAPVQLLLVLKDPSMFHLLCFNFTSKRSVVDVHILWSNTLCELDLDLYCSIVQYFYNLFLWAVLCNVKVLGCLCVLRLFKSKTYHSVAERFRPFHTTMEPLLQLL